MRGLQVRFRSGRPPVPSDDDNPQIATAGNPGKQDGGLAGVEHADETTAGEEAVIPGHGAVSARRQSLKTRQVDQDFPVQPVYGLGGKRMVEKRPRFRDITERYY